MKCPICGSSAVVAKVCSDNIVEKVQAGQDAYDVIYDDGKSECRSCGHIFTDDEAEHNEKEQGR